ncbi:hypothetical protein AaE_009472 [Aphanomyces astaci]|uniref:Uncharacterized protein n=1 Tax=Aphanomyces astaci TaxID=112090 RepID=A0A6A4ZSD5_APHAT|nr:hypothetical protein AaE_009472 [Aphanomyces astaci]
MFTLSGYPLQNNHEASMGTQTLAADIAAIERQELECHMERVALDFKCIELQHSLDEHRRRHRRRMVGRAAIALAESLDRTLVEQRKLERDERERLRSEREHAAEVARLARQEARDKEVQQMAEEKHKMEEAEAAKKRQKQQEKLRVAKELAAKHSKPQKTNV